MSILSLDAVKIRLLKYRKIVKGPESTPCWLWTGAFRDNTKANPYGDIRYRYRNWLVHRLSYLVFRGMLNPKLVIDHLCHRPLCFNPAHLEEVPLQVNAARGRSWNAEKTHCPQGHVYDFWRFYPNGKLKRGCRRCWTRYKKEARKKSPMKPTKKKQTRRGDSIKTLKKKKAKRG